MKYVLNVIRHFLCVLLFILGSYRNGTGYVHVVVGFPEDRQVDPYSEND